MKKVRVGIIGAGGIANAHLAAYSNCENAEVAAICDVSIPKAYKMMEEVNAEMAKGGYMVISGRVNKRFFYEKIGCAAELNNDKEE